MGHSIVRAIDAVVEFRIEFLPRSPQDCRHVGSAQAFFVGASALFPVNLPSSLTDTHQLCDADKKQRKFYIAPGIWA